MKLVTTGIIPIIIIGWKQEDGKIELNDTNVIEVLNELLPYIEADGGWLEYVETEEGYVKVRLGGACSTCAMSSMTLKQGIEKKLMMEIPDVKGVVQVL